MQKDIRSYFNKSGHWASVCTSKTPEKSSPSSSRGGSTRGSEYPLIQCPCGNGPCSILVSKTEKNPGRSFYTCPVQGRGSCRFFKWCDEIKKEVITVPPECPCGAGTCRQLIEVRGPNVGRIYFVCPIKKGLGPCPFFKWADNQSSAEVNFPVDNSKGYGLPRSLCYSNEVFDVLDNDLQTEQHERMEVIVSNPHNSLNSEALPRSTAQTDVMLKENQDSGSTSRILPEKEHPSLCLTTQNESTVPNSAIRLSAIEELNCDEQSVQECSELYNSEKVCFDNISKVHEKAVFDYTCSSIHLQSLRKEASHVREMLRQIEDKMLCCEAETSKLETDVDKINTDMLESKRRLQKAEDSLKLCKQREEERCAAKTPLETICRSMKVVCGLPLRKRQKL